MGVKGPPQDPAEYHVALERIRKAPAAELFGYARYDDQLPTDDWGRTMDVGAAEIRMASLTTRDQLPTVMQRYQRQLGEKKIHYYTSYLSASIAYISFRDSDDGFMRTLAVFQQNESTMVIAAIGDPERLLDSPGNGAVPADWPMPPVLGKPFDMKMTQEGQMMGIRRVQLAVSNLDEVMRFYSNELPRMGWKAAPNSEASDDRMRLATYVRGRDRCTVGVQALDGRSSSMTLTCLSGGAE